MPVKKKTETAEEASPKPRGRRTKKVAPEADAVAEASVPAPAEEPKPRGRRTRKPSGPIEESPIEPTAEVAQAEVEKAPAKRQARTNRRPKPEPIAESPANTTKPKPARRRAPVVEEPAPPETEPAKAEPIATEAKTPRRGRRPKQEPTPSPVVAGPVENPNEEVSLASAMVWRTAQSPAQPATPEARTEETEDPERDESRFATRRSRGRKRRERREPIVPEAAVHVEAPERELAEEPRPIRSREPGRERTRERERERPAVEARAKALEPERKHRGPIAIPDDGARVVLRNGVPVIVRHKTVYPPVCFFASAFDEAHFVTVLEEVRLAAEHGVHLFSFLVELEVDMAGVNDAVAAAAYFVRKVSAIDPEAQILLRTVIAAPSGWEKRFPRARYLTEDGGLADPSVCDDDFWKLAEECLRDYVAKLRRLDTGGHILGLHVERGEWFVSAATGYDTSVAAQERFRAWLRQRYRHDATTLRAAWFDGQVQFDTVGVPEEQGLRKSGAGFVRTDRKSRRWVDYHLFLSDATCERVTDLAYAVKSASEGRYLVGVSYGYTFEWSHPHSGHLSLGKLLRCPELDYIAGPPSYRNREPGGSAPFPGPIDSIALNGKLYLSEEDFKTPISGRREPDDFNPVMKTPQALESVHWRGVGSALAHCSGVCWMDSWGNGWLNSRGIWERGARAISALTWRMAAPFEAPDVAVFVDERSLAYLVDPLAFEALVQNVREAVLRSGLSVGFYLLSDLAHRENFPDSKLYVFTNAWDIRPEVRSAIKTRLQRDGKVLLWMYAAGLFEGGRESLERVREVTGIALRPQPFNSRSGTTILNFRDPICQALPDKETASGGQLEPSYFAIPEDGRVLGEYSATGLPSFVIRQFEGEKNEDWTSVFLGEPVVSAGFFRALGQMAGAHVWSFADDVVHVRPPFLTVHCSGTGLRTLALPEKWVAYSLTNGEWQTMESNSLRFHALDGASHSFLVGLRSEVEHTLASDPAESLRLETPPPTQENTVRWEEMAFDIPIMKLDEWVEESWSDDLADDLLLKPSLIDIAEETDSEDESPESQQRSRGGRRRRRRRRGGNGGGGSEESANPRREGADRAREPEVVNVVFRKRE